MNKILKDKFIKGIAALFSEICQDETSVEVKQHYLKEVIRTITYKFTEDIYKIKPYMHGEFLTIYSELRNALDQKLLSLQIDSSDEVLSLHQDKLNAFLNEYTYAKIETFASSEYITPEILGTVFETLLGLIDTPVGKNKRKATGTYFTPREIVNYMVDEALKGYIQGEEILDEVELKTLFFLEAWHHPWTNKQIKDIAKALSEAKIIDPAVGAGAFIVAMLVRIALILEAIKTPLDLWIGLTIEDDETRQQLKTINPEAVYMYGALNCLYGNDIQPLTIEITRERLFLALIDADQNASLLPMNKLIEHFTVKDTLLDTYERQYVQQTII